jgi:hypothetical protein
MERKLETTLGTGYQRKNKENYWKGREQENIQPVDTTRETLFKKKDRNEETDVEQKY